MLHSVLILLFLVHVCAVDTTTAVSTVCMLRVTTGTVVQTQTKHAKQGPRNITSGQTSKSTPLTPPHALQYRASRHHVQCKPHTHTAQGPTFSRLSISHSMHYLLHRQTDHDICLTCTNYPSCTLISTQGKYLRPITPDISHILVFGIRGVELLLVQQVPSLTPSTLGLLASPVTVPFTEVSRLF